MPLLLDTSFGAFGIKRNNTNYRLFDFIPVPALGDDFHVNVENTGRRSPNMSNLSKGGTKKDTKMRIRAFPVSTAGV